MSGAESANEQTGALHRPRPAATVLEAASYAGYATKRFADKYGLQAAAAISAP